MGKEVPDKKSVESAAGSDSVPVLLQPSARGSKPVDSLNWITHKVVQAKAQKLYDQDKLTELFMLAKRYPGVLGLEYESEKSKKRGVVSIIAKSKGSLLCVCVEDDRSLWLRTLLKRKTALGNDNERATLMRRVALHGGPATALALITADPGAIFLHSESLGYNRDALGWAFLNRNTEVFDVLMKETRRLRLSEEGQNPFAAQARVSWVECAELIEEVVERAGGGLKPGVDDAYKSMRQVFKQASQAVVEDVVLPQLGHGPIERPILDVLVVEAQDEVKNCVLPELDVFKGETKAESLEEINARLLSTVARLQAELAGTKSRANRPEEPIVSVDPVAVSAAPKSVSVRWAELGKRARPAAPIDTLCVPKAGVKAPRG